VQQANRRVSLTIALTDLCDHNVLFIGSINL